MVVPEHMADFVTERSVDEFGGLMYSISPPLPVLAVELEAASEQVVEGYGLADSAAAENFLVLAFVVALQ